MLSLQKDTYETLGILGTPSRFAPKRQRHCQCTSVARSWLCVHLMILPRCCPVDVEVDLREPGMRAGKPGYERLKRSLHKFGELDMMFSFYDAQGVSRPPVSRLVQSSLKLWSCRPKPTSCAAGGNRLAATKAEGRGYSMHNRCIRHTARAH